MNIANNVNNLYLCSMDTWLTIAIEAALKAGKAIMEVYAQPFEVYTKDDDSPVTQADLRASNIIKETLQPTGLPFVSEEDLPPDRSQYKRYWLVDPLDGTAEFVKRNGEFTVNIALIDNKQPVLGVIYAPVTDQLWFADGGRKAFGSQPSVPSPQSSVLSPSSVYCSRISFSPHARGGRLY